MNVDRPVFMLGSGRSGTKVFSNMPSLHRDLYWISNVSMRMPFRPFTSLRHRLFDSGNFGLKQKRKDIVGAKVGLRISPIEPDAAYDRVGFRSDIRLTEADCIPELDERSRQAISSQL